MYKYFYYFSLLLNDTMLFIVKKWWRTNTFIYSSLPLSNIILYLVTTRRRTNVFQSVRYQTDDVGNFYLKDMRAVAKVSTNNGEPLLNPSRSSSSINDRRQREKPVTVRIYVNASWGCLSARQRAIVSFFFLFFLSIRSTGLRIKRRVIQVPYSTKNVFNART